FVGKTLEALVEDKVEEDGKKAWGRTYRDAPEVDGLVEIVSDRNLQPGSFVKVKIKEVYEHDMAGEAVERED
ncbi:MAG: TRAM domain-containing protein, partial [Thermovirga sp.]|nr:TRAM domain-containing protein [Thermovirga sp.]